MKLLYPVLLLLLTVSCQDKKKLPEDEIIGIPDHDCRIVYINTIVSFRHLSVEEIIGRLKNKIDSIEIDNFGKQDLQNMQDSIIKNVFNLQAVLSKGDLVIDTANLLNMKDDYPYYSGGSWTPLPLYWNRTSDQISNFTYQTGDGFDIGYQFNACIQRFVSGRRVHKRQISGTERLVAENLKGSIDKVVSADCLFNLEIDISVDEKAPFFGYKKRHYHIVMQDTATIFAPEGPSSEDIK